MTDKELLDSAQRFANRWDVSPKQAEDIGTALEFIDELIDALRSHQWRPIETAPRDETNILVAWGHGTDYSGNIEIMQWSEFGGGGFTEKYMSAPLVRELKNQPTHWMPLPSPPGVKSVLSSKVEGIFNNGAPPIQSGNPGSIFVVHGRDHDSRDQLELVLRRLGLSPLVLQVTGGGGDTLIEALEKNIGKSALSSFGIVLMTPDDLGYLKSEKPEDAKPRARQNVVMEMGMLLASLTRKRCAILQKGFVEIPSNMGGVRTIPFNEHVREAVPKLVQRLQEAGFELDPGAIGLAQG